MTLSHLAAVVALCAVTSFPAAAASQPVSPSPSPTTVAVVKKILADLASDDWRVRRRAAQSAWDLPADAAPLLGAAMDDQKLDLEVRLRVREAYDQVYRRALAAGVGARQEAQNLREMIDEG